MGRLVTMQFQEYGKMFPSGSVPIGTDPQHSCAVVLRVSRGKGATVYAQLFSEKFGRISCSIVPKRQAPVPPLCLIEAAFSLYHGQTVVARDVCIIDAFLEIRHDGARAKGAGWMRDILEKCLPWGAPSQPVWDCLLSLLSHAKSFTDWKMVPLLLALLLFEQEGVSVKSLVDNPMLSPQAKETAQKILTIDSALVQALPVPEDLFAAAMESIGVGRNAKGGT